MSYTLDGFVNGDQDNSNTQNTIRGQITSVTNTSDALVDGTHTNNVLDGGYSIKTTVTQSPDLKNYNVVAKQGNTVTLTPVTVTINGGMTQTYGDDTKTFATPDVTGLVNGDTLGDVSYAIWSDGQYNTSKGNRTTADAGTYSGEWRTTGAVINHGDLTDKLGTKATGNYIVTGSGDIHVEKATLTVNAKDFMQTYGNLRVCRTTQIRRMKSLALPMAMMLKRRRLLWKNRLPLRWMLQTPLRIIISIPKM